MNKILTAFCFVLFVFEVNFLFSQINQIKGFVSDTKGGPVEYFTAAILNVADSNLVAGGAFIDGYFSFEDVKQRQCLVQIRCVGFRTITLPVDFSQFTDVDLGTILMESLELIEVSIVAKRPVFHQEGGKLLVNINGTSLSEAGNLIDALKRCPGLIVDNDNNITVFGKGSPIIYINNREVQNKSEIEVLQANDITGVEIDRSPSSQYSASGKAVVRIKTKSMIEKCVNLQLFNRSTFAREYRNTSGIQLNNKMRKTATFMSYSYENIPYKVYEDHYEINQQPDYMVNNHSESYRNSDSKIHNFFVRINQELNKHNNLGIQYSFVGRTRNGDTFADQYIDKTNTSEVHRNVVKKSNAKRNLQTLNVNYKLDFDSVRSLLVVADYSWVKDRSSEDIDENNLTGHSMLSSLISNQNKYRVYTGRIDYETPFFKMDKLKAGVKVAKVNNNGTAISIDQGSYQENYRIVDKIEDRINAGYFVLNEKLGDIKLEGGLRFEHTKTNITSEGTTVLDSSYNNLFPSILLSKTFSDQMNATLSYTRKIDRPGFNELSTDITYFDSLSYHVGNPSIRPTISDNIDLTIGLSRSLSVYFGYIHNINDRILSALNDENHPDIIKYTPVNIHYSDKLLTSINYNYNEKRLNSTLSCGVEQPFVKIPYLGGDRKINKLSWYVQSNNNITLSKTINFYLGFWYKSSNVDLMTVFRNSYNLSSGFDFSFFDEKLQVSLFINDILNSTDSYWEDRYGNIISGMKRDNDNTWFRFSAKYNFNHFSGGTKKQSSNQDELNRL